MTLKIGIHSRKGGVGKSTTAVGLALAAATRSTRFAGCPIVVVDTDRRAASAEWLSDQPCPNVEVYEAATERLLTRFASAELDPDALVIIDTPNSTDSPSLVRIADEMSHYVLVPARVGGLELSALSESIQEVMISGKQYGIVLTATITGSSSLKSMVSQLDRLSLNLLGVISHRVAVQDANLSPFPLSSLLAYEAVLERLTIDLEMVA